MTRHIQHSFAGGELSPSMYARTDLSKYAAGLARCLNFYPLAHGSATFRPGLQFVNVVKDSTRRVRVVPFRFSTVQAYILELGHLTLRVYKDRARVVLSSAPAWSGATAYVAGDNVSYLGVNYTCILAHTNQVPPNVTYWYPLTGDIVEIPTPWSENELFDLSYTQSADVMSFAHPAHDIYELSRRDHDKWALTSFAPTISQPAPTSPSATGGGSVANTRAEYSITAVNTETGEESLPVTHLMSSDVMPSTNSPIYLSWTSAAGAGSYNVYRRTRYTGTFYGSPSFVGRSSTTSFRDPLFTEVTTDRPPTAARNPFSGVGNKPGAIAYYQQRLVAGGSDNRPHGFDMSQSGVLNNFNVSEPLRDDDAVSATVASLEVNRIRHFLPLRDLIILTTGGIFSVIPDDNGAITPTPNIRPHGSLGASKVRPLSVEDTFLFVKESGDRVHDLGYSFERDGYTGAQLSILAEHLFDGFAVVDWAHASAPDNVVWAVRDDGHLLSLTYVREHEVFGWADHETDGYVESVAAIPEGSETAVYTVVRRRVGGQWLRYIEALHSRRFGSIEDAFFVDSGISLDAPIAIAGASQTDPVVITTATNHGLLDGDYVDIDETVVGMPELFTTAPDGERSSKRYKVNVLMSTTFELLDMETGDPVDGTGFGEYLSGGNVRKAVSSVSGLDHLEGREVVVLNNGSVEREHVVSSGAITLAELGSRVHVGLSYTGRLETLNVEGGRTIQGRFKKISRLWLRLVRSRGIWAGPNEMHLSEAKWRTTEAYDEPTRLLTGDFDMQILLNWNTAGRVFLEQRDPLPFTLTALIMELEVGV